MCVRGRVPGQVVVAVGYGVNIRSNKSRRSYPVSVGSFVLVATLAFAAGCGKRQSGVAETEAGPGANCRVAIVSTPSARAASDVLTPTLSKQAGVVLLERDQIGAAFKELSLAASGITDRDGLRLGELLKADVVILLSVEETGPNEGLLNAKAVAVKNGVILGSLVVPWPIKNLQSWVSGVVAEFSDRWRNKLTVPRMVVLAFPRFKSSLSRTDSSLVEDAVHRLITERLLREEGILVADRVDAATLIVERDAGAADDSRFVIVPAEGFIDVPLDNAEALEIRLFVKSKSAGDKEIRAVGVRTDLPVLADSAARSLVQAVKGTPSIEKWDSKKEATYYSRRARWLMTSGCFADAQVAAETACFLGGESAELLELRLDAGVQELTRQRFAPPNFRGAESWNGSETAALRTWLEKFRFMMSYAESLDRAMPRSNRVSRVQELGDVDGIRMGLGGMLDAACFAWFAPESTDMESRSFLRDLLNESRQSWTHLEPEDEYARLLSRLPHAHYWCDRPEDVGAMFERLWVLARRDGTNGTARLAALNGTLRSYIVNPLNYRVRSGYSALLREGLRSGINACLASETDEYRRMMLQLAEAGLRLEPDPGLAFRRQCLEPLFDLRPPHSDPEALDRYLWRVRSVIESCSTLYEYEPFLIRQMPHIWDIRDRICELPDGPAHLSYLQGRLDVRSKWRREIALYMFQRDARSWTNQDELSLVLHHTRHHPAGDFCCRTYPFVLDAIQRVGNPAKILTLKSAADLMCGHHPELRLGNVAANNLSADGVLRVRGWDPSSLPEAKRTTSIWLQGPGRAPDGILYNMVCHYGQRGLNTVVETGVKTYVLKIKLPSMEADVIECPILPDQWINWNVEGIQMAANRLFIFYGTHDIGGDVPKEGGFVSVDLGTRVWSKESCPMPDSMPGYTSGWFILPVRLSVDVVPNMFCNNIAYGLVLIEADSGKQSLLASGMRTPSQTPLDKSGHRFMIAGVNGKGDVFIKTMRNQSVQQIYNVVKKTWRQPTGQDNPPQVSSGDPFHADYLSCAPSALTDGDVASWSCDPLRSHGGPWLVLRRRDGRTEKIPIDIPNSADVRSVLPTPHGLILSVGGCESQLTSFFLVTNDDIRSRLSVGTRTTAPTGPQPQKVR